MGLCFLKTYALTQEITHSPRNDCSRTFVSTCTCVNENPAATQKMISVRAFICVRAKINLFRGRKEKEREGLAKTDTIGSSKMNVYLKMGGQRL